MPRTLLLLRHAKSSWDDPRLDDFDRPLNDRGRDAAPRIGSEMARRGWVPDTAIVSPALRTRQTWDLVSAELPRSPGLVLDASIYEAAPAAILSAIRGAPDRIGCLIVVGHNPGLELLSRSFTGPGSNIDAVRKLNSKYPTGGLAAFDLATTWSAFDENDCRLVDFVTPKDLA